MKNDKKRPFLKQHHSLSRYKKLIWFYLVRAEVVSRTLPLFLFEVEGFDIN